MIHLIWLRLNVLINLKKPKKKGNLLFMFSLRNFSTLLCALVSPYGVEIWPLTSASNKIKITRRCVPTPRYGFDVALHRRCSVNRIRVSLWSESVTLSTSIVSLSRSKNVANDRCHCHEQHIPSLRPYTFFLLGKAAT